MASPAPDEVPDPPREEPSPLSASRPPLPEVDEVLEGKDDPRPESPLAAPSLEGAVVGVADVELLIVLPERFVEEVAWNFWAIKSAAG